MTEPCPRCSASPALAGDRQRSTSPTDALRGRQHLLVRSADVLRLLKVSEIEWIEADGHHVRIRVQGEIITVRERLGRFEEVLDPLQFLRIHRSTIVNLDRVREFRHWFGGDFQVLLRDGGELRLSRSYRDRLRSLSLDEPPPGDGEPSGE
ncbi:MAG TPA: LytTR family DNA-binding domain-containing protein [Longimicrobium sp.]|jgi:two-component system LytT family response regulator